MKLMYSPGACSIGIHVLLEEIGKPYEAQLVNLREGAQFKPDFTAVNPKNPSPLRECSTSTTRPSSPTSASSVASSRKPTRSSPICSRKRAAIPTSSACSKASRS